jgi:hypothetical protein
MRQSYVVGGRWRMIGGSTKEQRGKAAEYREKFITNYNDYDKLSKVIHDNQDGVVDRSFPGLWGSIDFEDIRQHARIRPNPSGYSKEWVGTDRNGNRVRWTYQDNQGKKRRHPEGIPV